MAPDRVHVNGKFCAFRKTTFTARSLRIRHEMGGDHCPICRAPIDTECDVYLMINNYVLFPNCFAHASCVDPIGMQAAAEAMTYDTRRGSSPADRRRAQ